MADNIYTITIKNTSLKDKSFLLFQSLPKPANIPSDNVFTNVYQRAVQIVGNSDAEASFTISKEIFAIYGTSSASTDGLVKVRTSASRPAVLGPNGSRFYLSTVGKDGKSPFFEKEDTSTSAEGAFIVSSDHSFSAENPANMYFGIGAKVPGASAIVPVQTYQCQPGLVGQVFPKVKYYIGFGSYEPGTVVDLVSLGDVLEIDFSNVSAREATFTLNDKFQYIPDPNVEKRGIKWKFAPAKNV